MALPIPFVLQIIVADEGEQQRSRITNSMRLNTQGWLPGVHTIYSIHIYILPRQLRLSVKESIG